MEVIVFYWVRPEKYINSNQDSERKPHPFCLVSISKDFKVNNMKKAELTGYRYHYFVDYNTIDIRNIINIHKYLMNLGTHQDFT